MNWKDKFQQPEMLLYFMAAAVPLSFASWLALINNFAIEQVSFSGVEMGILQSLREVPGFLAFAVVFLLLIFREQTLATLSLILLGVGTAIHWLYAQRDGALFYYRIDVYRFSLCRNRSTIPVITINP